MLFGTRHGNPSIYKDPSIATIGPLGPARMLADEVETPHSKIP